MKAIIISLFFFAFIFEIIASLPGFKEIKYCSDYEGSDRDRQAYSKDFCNSLAASTLKKCCFFKYKSENRNYYNCRELEMSDYLNIDPYIKELKKTYDVKSLECASSSYLYGSLLLILVFLL